MRNRTRAMFALALVAMLVVAGCEGCAGTYSREYVLTPVLAQTWPAIQSDIERGASAQSVAAPAALAEWSAAMDSLDGAALVELRDRDWSGFRAMAEAGIAARIAAGELDDTTAASFYETVRQFEESLYALDAPSGEPSDPDSL